MAHVASSGALPVHDHVSVAGRCLTKSLHPKPQTLNPLGVQENTGIERAYTLNPKPQTLNPLDWDRKSEG